MSSLISYETARSLLCEHIPPLKTEEISLSKALGRVIASEVVADQHIPAFNKSVMDGYAVRSLDTAAAGSSLRVVAEIPAGRRKELSIGRNEAAAIMTGAPLPRGADAVVMVEKTERLSQSRVILHTAVELGENVAPQGSEVEVGDVVLERGQLLGPSQIGVLATFGISAVEVSAIPRVGILPTGSEIVEIEKVPKVGQIRNSNAPMLAAQSRRLGLPTWELPIARDDVGATRKAVQAALHKMDLVILTGGVSMGRHDYVPQVLKDEGVEIIFHKVSIKPGKPVLFGRFGEKLVFGLPGNPVSSLVTFELFVRPAVRRWAGLEEAFRPEVSAVAEAPFKNLSTRDFYAPGLAVSTDRGMAVGPVSTGGSADLVAFSRANCLVRLPAGSGIVEAGQRVRVLLLEEWVEKES